MGVAPDENALAGHPIDRFRACEGRAGADLGWCGALHGGGVGVLCLSGGPVEPDPAICAPYKAGKLHFGSRRQICHLSALGRLCCLHVVQNARVL